jgi:ribose 5-phosphate isomerase A
MNRARLAASAHAASLVQQDMLVGLGTGRASTAVIQELGRRIREDGLRFTGVPTSEPSRAVALEAGISLALADEISRLDLTLDGADEADNALNVTKGGGGALVREKLLARASAQLALVIETPKHVARLGQFPVPVAIIPFAWRSTRERVLRHCVGANVRMGGERRPYITDDGLFILDLQTGPIDDPSALEQALKAEVGVVEVGLFVGLCDLLIIGREDGSVDEIRRPGRQDD